MHFRKFWLMILLMTGSFIPLSAQEDSDPVGRVQRDMLFSKRNQEVFLPEYENYVPDADAVKFIRGKKNDVKIKIVMGFWCEDSKLHVPRMIKVLDEAKWDTGSSDQVKIFGVDKDKKASFEGFNAMNIVNVPTFIVYYKDREIGRIIENPKVSLEKDLVEILKLIK